MSTQRERAFIERSKQFVSGKRVCRGEPNTFYNVCLGCEDRYICWKEYCKKELEKLEASK